MVISIENILFWSLFVWYSIKFTVSCSLLKCNVIGVLSVDACDFVFWMRTSASFLEGQVYGLLIMNLKLIIIVSFALLLDLGVMYLVLIPKRYVIPWLKTTCIRSARLINADPDIAGTDISRDTSYVVLRTEVMWQFF